jgi:hypothetical protein
MQQNMQQNSIDGSHPIPKDTLGDLSMMEDPDDEDEEACAQANIQQILEHNCALRQNFEEVCLNS